MEPAALIEALEGLDRRRASALLRASSRQAGLGQAYLDRTVALYAQDHASLIRLAAHGSAIQRHADRADLVLRARAIGALVQGRFAESARLFVAAGDAAEDEVNRLAFKTGAISALASAGRPEEGARLGREIVDGLLALDEPGLAARAALNLGAVLLQQDRYQELIEVLEPTASALEEAGYGVEAASARLGVSSAHLFGGSLDESRRQAHRAMTAAERAAASQIVRLARLNLAHVALLRGRADEALDSFLSLSREFADVPQERARTLEFLGDAYARLNLWDEAVDAYHQAQATRAQSALSAAATELGLADAYRGLGDVEEARRAAERAERKFRRLGNLAWTSRAVADQALLGKPRAAARAVRLARQSGSPFFLAYALLAAAEHTEAAAIVRRYGYADLEWRVAYLEAQAAEGADRLRAYRRMFAAISRGRASVSSTASRASYLRDKSAAIREYLHELLLRPTPGRVREAVRVVVQSRSVALLDEVLGARELPAAVTEELASLRDELQTLADNEPNGANARRLVADRRNLAGVQRRWSEATRTVIQRALPVEARPDTLLFMATQGGYVAALGDQIVPVGDSRVISDALRWLHFDLSAPMVDPSASAERVTRALCDVGNLVLGPVWPHLESIQGVSADGDLWRMPWDAALAALGEDRTWEIRLHPGMSGHPDMGMKLERVALWVSQPMDLPFAERESEAILARFPDAEVFRTAEEVRQNCRGSFDLVHVIGHARLREANPMFSGFQFPDGQLYAAEVARIPFRTDLAVLSACDTGAVSLVSMDEPDGLARAFLARGAASVVASAWPLDDEAAHRFVNDLYNLLGAGRSLGSAMTQARRNLRSWNPHPYYWGCPMLYGGYRP